MPLGEWHHVAGVFDGSELRLYVDGVLDASGDYSGSMATNDFPVWLGANSEAAGALNGRLDDVRVYSYALSQIQIQELVDMGNLPPIVDAGQDQMFPIYGGSLQLDGTVTEDGEPVAATVEWTKTSGPGDVTFSPSADIKDPTVTFSDDGTYVLRLTADDTLTTVYDEVTITVPICQDVIDNGLLIVGDISGTEETPDCRIDLYDFAVFAGSWLRCNDPQDPACDFPY